MTHELTITQKGIGTETASGSVASFETDIVRKIPSLKADIMPVQSGSGDPSPTNIRPITGWTGVSVIVSPTTDGQDGTTYSIIFPASAGTVYGGTVDVAKGKLVVDTIKYVPDGVGAVSKGLKFDKGSSSDYNIYYSLVRASSPLITSQTIDGNYPTVKCSHFPLGSQSTINSYYVGSKQIRVCLDKNDERNTAALFNAWVKEQYDAGTPLEMTAMLEEPLEYDLTPTEISTLIGQNNIWADTGEVSVMYAKLTEAIEHKLSIREAGN